MEQWKHSSYEQLKLDELVIKHILKIIGSNDPSTIKKIIASPTEVSLDLKEKLTNVSIQFLNIEHNIDEDLYQTEHSSVEFTEEIYKKLIAAFAFLSSCYFLEKRWTLDEEKISKDMTEPAKAKEIIESFQSQSAMEKVGKGILKSDYGSIYVWLDPVQQEIMSDANPRQVIIGPASTGKTLLIQLKVLELCRNDRDSEILILLPHISLVRKYQHFFLKSEVNLNNVFLVTPSDNWKKVLEERKNCHWFVDELVAMHLRYKELNDIIIKMASNFGPQQLLWITVDFAQKFNSHQPNLDLVNLKFLEDASKKHLMLIHRCTKMVFELYAFYCSPFVDLGHQYEGIQTLTISIKPSQELISDSVHVLEDCVENLMTTWTKKDICIVISIRIPEAPMTIVLFYLELKSKFPGVNFINVFLLARLLYKILVPKTFKIISMSEFET